MISLGDMAQFHVSSRNNLQIKTRLFSLANELSTGRVEDLSAHLKGDTKRLADIDRRLTVGAAQLSTAKALSGQFEVMQLALNGVNGARETLLTTLLTVPPSANSGQIDLAVDAGRTAFEQMVAGLNTRLADQALFAGTATDGRALADADVMLDALSAAVAGAATAADMATAIDDWFNQPGGGFETLGYLGDTGAAPTRRIDEVTTVEIGVRADDIAFRELLAGTALAALATDGGTALSDSEQAALLGEAATRLLSAAAPLVNLQAAAGASEGRIEAANARLSAQTTALSLMRNGMIAADPFETASALEQVQIQLETHYTVTARLSRLSLAEYLR